MSKTAEKKAEQEAALAKLREILKPGDEIHTVLRHCSRSGMSRSISLIIARDGAPEDITYWAARALGDRIDQRRGGIVVGGCGMDMGFHLVYSLSRRLFPDGFGTPSAEKPHKRANDPQHAAAMIEAGHKFRGRNCDASGWDNDGGYALKHRWL